MKGTLHESAIESWHDIIQTQDFSRFTALHYDYSPHWIWYFSKEHRTLLPHCTSVGQMISSLAEVNSGNKFCMFCEVFNDNIVDHYLHVCSHLDNERSKMWQEILSLNILLFSMKQINRGYSNVFIKYVFYFPSEVDNIYYYFMSGEATNELLLSTSRVK